MTPLQIAIRYIDTMDFAAIAAAIGNAVKPGDDDADIERLCVTLVDAFVPDELLPVWQDEAQEIIDDAGERIAHLLMTMLRTRAGKRARSRRRLSPAVNAALSLGAASRARAAELAALPTVEVSEPA